VVRGVLKAREDRIANDAYYTPWRLADAICKRLAEHIDPRGVWDPCCGDLAFVEAAFKAWGARPRLIHFTGTDLPEYDFLKADVPFEPTQPDLIVSNPPYLLAEQFVHRALSLLPDGGHLAFLLRLSFLCGQKRVESLWSKSGLRYLMPIAPRPSFTPDGKTDASEYGLFVWQRGYTGNAEILPHLRWQR
jgi:hypothetical protein